MAYIARKRLLVGHTQKVIGQEPSSITYKGQRRIELPDGTERMKDVFEPVMADVHEPIYREPGEIVPEAAGWSPNVLDAMLSAGQIAMVSDAALEPEKPKRSGTVKASS